MDAQRSTSLIHIGSACALILCSALNIVQASGKVNVDIHQIPSVIEDAYEPFHYEQVPREEYVAAPTWYVTEDEVTDALGNSVSITNFLITEFENEVEWLQDNYVEGWPYGPVSDITPMQIPETVAIAIATNCWRESGCIPSLLQGGDWDIGSLSHTEVIRRLKKLGTQSHKAYGVIQWDGVRRLNLATFCEASGFDPRSLEVQLHFLAYEAYCSGEHSSYISMLNRYSDMQLTLRSVTSCAERYRLSIERGGTPGVNSEILKNWGGKWSYAWGQKPDGGWYDYILSEIN